MEYMVSPGSYTLSAVAISKRYQKRLVVDAVSLQLNNGEIVGLLGPNGAGKTTVFYMMAGLVMPEVGCIKRDGHDMTRETMSERAARGIGYLPQEASVFRKMTVVDNLLAILELRRLSPAERRHRCDALLDEFQLQRVRHTLGMHLSGGERRRVEIARALAGEPKFLLLDEPFAGVDPISVTDIQTIIRRLTTSRGIGIFITDHNVRETLGICQRGYIMNHGRIVAEGAPDVLLAHPRVRSEYLGEHFSL